MIIVNTIEELIDVKESLNGTVGFVPTMGALHHGHLSLINRSKEENNFTIVSIFVNPTQFLEGEDLDKYPRREDADRKICSLAGVDVLFMPSIDVMYSKDELKIMAPAHRGYILEGQKRPGHFDGMLQIVMKLLNLTSANKAYFGKKDAQQLSLIEGMVKNYFMDVEIVPCDIVRDENGLALSSRNSYLTKESTKKALELSASLKVATNLIVKEELNVEVIIEHMKQTLKNVDSIEYISIVNRKFEQINNIEIGNSIILVAAWVDGTRLIDNIWV